tara:strand:- start:2638 stop:3285 length:648 start_codon:yes stop_codon:yes gene_type:complete
MSAVATAIVATSYMGSKAAERGANAQAAASDRAAELQNQQYQDTVARQKPFYDVGVNALPDLVNASKYQNFGMDQFQADPGYAFRLSEGQKQLDRTAASRGGLLSGGALKAATRYGQDMGSQEYTNAFNRYQVERNARLAPLQALTGMGQTTAQQVSNAGQTMATNVGNDITNSAAARASGYVGQANALTGGLSTYLNYTSAQDRTNALRNLGSA